MTKTTASTDSRVHVETDTGVSRVSRRKFLNYAGASAGLVMAVAACKKDNNPTTTTTGVDFGSGDTGILNYAYALEQLEAAFYLQVITTLYSGITPDEQAILTDIRDHEVAHREFFKTALSTNAITSLEVDFSKIGFTKRDSVLATAKAFEDLGVSAYNGAGRLITNPDYLTLAGKIVSVEARHAARIRDLIGKDTFVGTDIIDANGLEMSKAPGAVLAIAGTYIKTKINASNLPS